MSSSGDVAQLYKNVIEEVIKTVRTDFVNMGVDEQVLVDLQTLWEQKLIESRVFNPQDFPITASRDYSQNAGFFYSAPGMVRPAGYNTGSVASLPLAPYYAPPRPVTSATIQVPTMSGHISTTIRPVPKVTPQTEDSLGEVETGHNDNIPQYDGADDLLPLEVHLDLTIPQYDGADNTSKEEPNGPDPIEPSAKRSKQSETVEGSGDTVDSVAVKSDPGKATTPPEVTDELGSDLDDEDDLNDEVDDENISDLILCQYEKISRVRTRWRGVLRAGIIHVRGADFAFSRATTDFDW